VIRRALVAAVVAGGIVSAAAAPGTAAASSDQEIARTGVLVPSDFPSGWNSSTRGQSSDAALDATAAKVVSCEPFLAFSKANKRNPRAKSPNFAHEQSNVTDAVSVYPSTAKAVAAVRILSDSRVRDCFERVYSSITEQQLAKNAKSAGQVVSVNTSVEPVSDLRIGDEAVAYQGKINVVFKDGSTQGTGVGIAWARVGDAVVGYSWTSFTDISAALQPAVVKSVSRLQRAQSVG
jgi:hypothetical protein